MWWENKGKQRVMALRNRKSSLNSKGIKRRTIFAGLFLCVFLVLVFQYGGFLLSLNDVQNQQSQTESNSSRYKGDVNDHSTSNTTNKKRVKKNCKFAAAIDGYIEGCVNNCQGFSTLNEAKMRCSENELCTGITRIPWLDAHEQYELRSGSRVFASIDGQVSYRLSGCRSKSKDSALVNREYETKSKTLDTDDYDWGMKTDSNDDRGTTSKGSENITFERIGQIRFWEPPMDFENSYHKVGTFVNGDPTIFVGIASYRDPMCTATIERLFQWAKYPHRIFVGAAEQNAEGDIPCVNPKRPCKEDPEQLLCKYVNQIRIMPVKAKDAMGP
uniref:Uncharacterized protein n=1 Tax=Aplanochytrium stocchinoi TaxID=215587 RepID=A0A6S8AZ63_9STRA